MQYTSCSTLVLDRGTCNASGSMPVWGIRCRFEHVLAVFFFRSDASAMGTANQTVHIAFRALQGDEFRGEVVTMNRPLAAIANRAQLPLVTAAE